jgi:prophage regulatory protein
MTRAKPVKPTEAEVPMLRILRPENVAAKLTLSSSKLFDMIAKGQFPKPFVIVPGGRAVGWLESDVDAWIMDRMVDNGTDA